MFKRSLLPDGDQQIGIRLQYLRRRHGMTQSELGSKVGLTRAQVTDVESCRTSLKLKSGWEICRVIDIHPGWLLLEVPSLLKPFPEESPLLKRVERIVDGSPKSPFLSLGNFLWMLGPDGEKMLLDEELTKSGLTERTESGNTQAVNALKSLLNRLNRVTSRRGMKAQLAKDLNIPPASLSMWLSGSREPGGDVTLRLLHWVEQHEANK